MCSVRHTAVLQVNTDGLPGSCRRRVDARQRETPTARVQPAPSPRQRLLSWSAEIMIRVCYKAAEQAIGTTDEGAGRRVMGACAAVR